MKIVVASTSTVKLFAVKEAVLEIMPEALGKAPDEFQFIPVSAKSGVNIQPYGLDEIEQGASNRLLKAADAHSEYDLLVSIENGLLKEDHNFTDIAVIILCTPGYNTLKTLSAGIAVPRATVQETREAGFDKRTWGQTLAMQYPHSPCQADDPHSFLTNNKFSRKKILADAIKIALAQIYRAEFAIPLF
ncbi:MAG: DUF84 family protein [Parcubacteria group bacterium]